MKINNYFKNITGKIKMASKNKIFKHTNIFSDKLTKFNTVISVAYGKNQLSSWYMILHRWFSPPWNLYLIKDVEFILDSPLMSITMVLS